MGFNGFDYGATHRHRAGRIRRVNARFFRAFNAGEKVVEFLRAGVVFCADFNGQVRPALDVGDAADEDFVIVNRAFAAVVAEVEGVGDCRAARYRAFAQGAGFKF